MYQNEELYAYIKAANQILGAEGRHLNEEEMVAYYRRQTSIAEREAAEAHLSACKECLQLFRDVRDLFEPGEKKVSDAKIRESWQKLWARMQMENEQSDVHQEITYSPPKPSTPTVPRITTSNTQQRRSFFNSRAALMLAACLVLSLSLTGVLAWQLWQARQEERQARQQVAQLSSDQQRLEGQLRNKESSNNDQLRQEREQRIAAEAKNEQLREQLAEMRQLQQNIPVMDIRLANQKGVGEELRVDVPPAVNTFMLSIRFSSTPYEFPKYTIEILNKSGRAVLLIPKLKPVPPAGSLNLTLNRADLSGGEYRIRVFGQRGGEKKQLGEHKLSLNFSQ